MIFLQSKGLSRVSPGTTVQKHQFFGTQPSLWSSSHDTTTRVLREYMLFQKDFGGTVNQSTSHRCYCKILQMQPVFIFFGCDVPSLAAVFLLIPASSLLSLREKKKQEFPVGVESAGAPMWSVCSSTADEVVGNDCRNSQPTAILKQLPWLEWLLAFLPQPFRLELALDSSRGFLQGSASWRPLVHMAPLAAFSLGCCVGSSRVTVDLFIATL